MMKRVVGSFLILLSLLSCAAWGQDPQRNLPIIKSFELRYSEPEAMLHNVMNLLRVEGVKAVADSTTGRLVVRARQDEIELISEMVRQLDVKPINSPYSALETEVLAPVHRDAGSISQPIGLVLGSRGKMAVDEARNVIVIRDSEDGIERARSILRELDLPRGSLTLQFLVLGSDGSQTAVPQSEKVLKELSDLGLKEYGILGRASVRTVEGQQFESQGFFKRGNLRLTGSVRMTAGSSVEIAINAEMVLSNPSDQQQSGRATLRTTVNMPIGHLVVVGLAPAGGGATEPLVLAMTVRSDV